MKKLSLHDWKKNSSLALCTCYDAWSAKLLATSPLDAILVGDSAAMVMHGHESTLPIDSAQMAQHVASVARGLNNQKFLIGDMPFLSFRKDLRTAMNCVEELMKAGAHAVKLEGLRGHEEIVKHIVGSGVPVMGHLGLTPQSVHGLGGFKVQGRSQSVAEQLLADAKELENLGCFSLVLECVPSQLAQKITQSVGIPTIGIGAGPHCDGQILVLHDLLGFGTGNFKFVRRFGQGDKFVGQALEDYCSSVKNKKFPSIEESFE